MGRMPNGGVIMGLCPGNGRWYVTTLASRSGQRCVLSVYIFSLWGRHKGLGFRAFELKPSAFSAFCFGLKQPLAQLFLTCFPRQIFVLVGHMEQVLGVKPSDYL